MKKNNLDAYSELGITKLLGMEPGADKKIEIRYKQLIAFIDKDLAKKHSFNDMQKLKLKKLKIENAYRFIKDRESREKYNKSFEINRKIRNIKNEKNFEER